MQYLTKQVSRRSALLIAFLMGGVLFSESSLAAPSVSSASGAFTHKGTITITGSGFGAKNPVAPVLWAPFDDSASPSTLGRATSWQEVDCIEWTSTGGRIGGGVKTLDSCSRDATAQLGIDTNTLGINFVYNAYGQKSYIFRHRRMGYTNDVNLKSLELIGEDYTFDANWVFNHSSNQWISQGLSPSSYFYGISQVPAENNWATEEHIVWMNTASGQNVQKVEVWGNGVKRLDVSGEWFITGRDSSSTADDMRRIKPVFHGDYNISAGSMSTTPEWWDSVYVDSTWSRVMLGNMSTFAASTQREIQIPTAWSDGSVTITANQGAFTSGATAYLYVIDSTGAVNTTGYPITIGSGGGGDTTPPTSPTNLAATSPSQSSISVSWTASTDAVGVTGYIVERCQGSGCSNFIQVGTPTASPFVDSGLTANTFYNYHIRARDAANNLSGWSNVVGATTQGASSGTPTISSVSGTVSNGNTITISGSGFGTKATARPVAWDNFEDGSVNASATIGTWSDLNSLVVRNTNSRHARSSYTAYTNLTGAWPSNSNAYLSGGSNSTTWYAQYWLYLGSNFNFSSNMDNSRGNVKFFRMWDTGSDSKNFVAAFHSGDHVCAVVEQCTTAGPTCYMYDYNPTTELDNGQWNLLQFEYKESSASDIADGVWRMWSNGDLVYNFSNLTTKCSGHTSNSRPFILGFFDSHDASGTNSDFYMDDAYIDNTWSRIELTNNQNYSSATIHEIQPPTTWSDSAATFTVNQGSFNSGTAYVFVTDANGTRNASGYPITIGSGGGGDTTPPTSPINLAATSPSQSSISVSWTASTDAVGVTGYIVERCQGSGCSNFTQVGTPTASPFVDSGLTANTFYNYHVRATDAAGNLSGWSNVVGATTQASTPVTELIIDNTDTNTSQSGSWSPSTNFPGYYGTDYHYSPNATGHWFEWTATTLVAGTYEVYAYWNANTDRPTDVSYLITHSGGTATRNNINQTQNGSQWNLLGTYTFGTTGTVRVQSGGTGTEGTVADAIRFVKTNTTPCNTVTTSNFSQAAYNSYGAPYDAFQTSTNLMNTTCTSADTHTINLTTGVTGDTTRIVYTKGYWYDAVTTAWRQYTGTCTGALNGEWCQGSVSAAITDANVSTASAAAPTYLVGMTCSVQGGSWKCGCRDTSCTNFSWQIQGAGQ